MTIFPESDKHDIDVSRFYFGWKKLLYYNPNHPTINPSSIIQSMTHYLKNRRGANHFKGHVKEFAKRHGIMLTKKGLLDVSVKEMSTEFVGKSRNGKILPNSILFLNPSGKNYQNVYQINLINNLTKNSVDEKPRITRTEYRSSALKDISSSCRLFREFASGERRLCHEELFGISTSIIHVESGTDTFKKILAGNPDFYDRIKQENFSFYLK